MNPIATCPVASLRRDRSRHRRDMPLTAPSAIVIHRDVASGHSPLGCGTTGINAPPARNCPTTSSPWPGSKTKVLSGTPWLSNVSKASEVSVWPEVRTSTWRDPPARNRDVATPPRPHSRSGAPRSPFRRSPPVREKPGSALVAVPPTTSVSVALTKALLGGADHFGEVERAVRVHDGRAEVGRDAIDRRRDLDGLYRKSPLENG